ncbi:metastasis-associated protein MTA1 isoform X1 [Loxodonta africana]|uniref:metastasis-associated protein MTA1 isoform X1 n=1 Tax=Loxodonta africana TaxID=9785 RepID=UPI0030CD9F91
MAANMYRVGDYVYFENSSSNPYLIRRIEELNKTANGNVEAKVVCFYRRRDISSTLIALADKHATLSVCYKAGPGSENEEEGEMEEEMENPEMVDLPEKLKHQLRHRELFLSRQLESLPATHIRGKCSVTLLNETESLKSYLEREDFFFYSLVYDPQQKTLLADKGEIRVGNRYQADITDLLKEGEEDGRDQSKLETKVWEAHNPLIDKQIDQFLVVARSVGTFARALDCSSSVRQPSLHMSAAAASRDITLFHAMDTLHKNIYDISKAISALVPQGGPVLCRDEMEEWSASEANLFEEALEKYGKDFTDIQQDFLPWKSLTSIIEYYYMWKTTDRYVQQKRLKAAEAESKLKQVYIPNYNKPNPNQINVNSVKAGVVNGTGAPGQSPGAGRACESCYTTQSYQWYSWGPPNMQCRLCASCWTYWKKYGGLKMPTRLDGERPGPNRSNMSPHGIPARSSGSPKFAMKTRQAFYLHTTKLTRIARRLCREILRPCHAARHPYMPINSAAIKAECTARLPEASQSPLVLKQVVRKPLEAVLRYLEAHPRPPKPEPMRGMAGAPGSLTPAKAAPVINNGSPTILGKRSYEQHNGTDGNMKKRLLMPSRGAFLGKCLPWVLGLGSLPDTSTHGLGAAMCHSLPSAQAVGLLEQGGKRLGLAVLWQRAFWPAGGAWAACFCSSNQTLAEKCVFGTWYPVRPTWWAGRQVGGHVAGRWAGRQVARWAAMWQAGRWAGMWHWSRRLCSAGTPVPPSSSRVHTPCELPHTQAHVHMHLRSHSRTCMPTHVHRCTCAHMHVLTYLHLCVHMHTRPYALTFTHIHLFTLTRAHHTPPHTGRAKRQQWPCWGGQGSGGRPRGGCSSPCVRWWLPGLASGFQTT